jgi:hypothetical protein
VSQRGRITREFTVWCGACLTWEQEGQENTIRQATKRFRKRGWRPTRRKGWMCPTCLKLRAMERKDSNAMAWGHE